MASAADVYEFRTVREDEISVVSEQLYNSFVPVSFTLAQLNLSRQSIDDWMRFELSTEENRKDCFVLACKSTDAICGVFLGKNYASVSRPLPNELASIGARYYFFQEIRLRTVDTLGLDRSGVIFTDFGFIASTHRGQKLAPTMLKELLGLYSELGYTDYLTETANPYLAEQMLLNGLKIVEEADTAQFEYNGVRPFPKSFAMKVLHRVLTPSHR